MNSNALEIAQLIFTIITTICALYLTYIGLIHSAKPRIKIKLVNTQKFFCDEETILIFGCKNIGFWYAKPMAVNLVIFCNFERSFQLIELLFGSTQSMKDSDVKIGVGNMQYLKAKGLKLTYGEEDEEFHAKVVMPSHPGKFKIRIAAFSDNGVSFKKTYYLNVISPPKPEKK